MGLESFSCTCSFVLGGGLEVNWENKACKYVHKHFFVFLSIVPEYSLSKHCKVTANHKLL